MNDNAFDDALAAEPDLSLVEDTLMRAPAPIAPPPQLRDSILAQIDDEPQVTALPQNKRPFVRMFAAAASVVALAGVGLWFATSNVTTQQPQETTTQVAAPTTANGTDHMNKIMSASDVRHGSAEVMGADLKVAVSDDMGKGCLMVAGSPSLDDGMEAQVWAVMDNGDMEFAGMIDEIPNPEGWMLIPPGTMKVMVTEEPAGGSASPSGDVLATVTLT